MSQKSEQLEAARLVGFEQGVRGEREWVISWLEDQVRDHRDLFKANPSSEPFRVGFRNGQVSTALQFAQALRETL